MNLKPTYVVISLIGVKKPQYYLQSSIPCCDTIIGSILAAEYPLPSMSSKNHIWNLSFDAPLKQSKVGKCIWRKVSLFEYS